MAEITRVGADLAKTVIQVHGVDAAGVVVTNRPLARDKFMAWGHPTGCKAKAARATPTMRRRSARLYMRTLLIQGAKSAVLNAHRRDDPISKWAYQLREKSGWQKAVVALANWHSYESDHVNGMGRCRAVRIWVRSAMPIQQDRR